MIRTRIAIALLLAVVTLTVYWQAGTFEFLNYDDNVYVTENPQVKGGLTWGGVREAFTTTRAANWHPLTWLSHMVDGEFYGLSPDGHHLTSVLLHGANALLLFLLLARMTGSLWPSAFTAALFALHPLRVESVAWVAERKDVLSSFFALLSLMAYARYAEKPSVARYIPVFGFFLLGLLAKPMLVTLPFLMLLLDSWPLNRFAGGPGSSGGAASGHHRLPVARLVVEKAPLALLSLGVCIITVLAQKSGNALHPLETYPLLSRFANALTAYASYLGKMLYPANLAVFYPLSDHSPGAVFGAALLVISVSLAVVRFGRKQPFLVTGWFWYLGSLVPVIGLVQVGLQSMADRYTYLPMIGIAIMVAWGGSFLAAHFPRGRRLLFAAAVMVIAVSSLLTWRQLGHWRNSATLYEHAIAVTENNYFAFSNLGSYLYDRQRYPEAARCFSQSLAAKPDQFDVHHNLGLAYSRLGEYDRAERHFLESMRIMPDFADPRYALALSCDTRYHLAFGRSRQNRLPEAIEGFLQVLRLMPTHIDAHYQLGIAYDRLGRHEQAIGHFAEAVRLNPDHAGARTYLDDYRQKK